MTKPNNKSNSGKTSSATLESPATPADTQITPVQSSAKSSVEKAQPLLSVISASIGIIGAASTFCVWLATTFYVGQVEVQPVGNVAGVSIKVYTKDGHESVFHTKKIALMPGEYHLEVISPTGNKIPMDTSVRFNETRVLPVSFPETTQSTDSASSIGNPTEGYADSSIAEQPKKKTRWWQFWRRAMEDAKDAAEVQEKQFAEANKAQESSGQ